MSSMTSLRDILIDSNPSHIGATHDDDALLAALLSIIAL